MPRKRWKHLTCRKCGERYRMCACYSLASVEARAALAWQARRAREEAAIERRLHVIARRREAVEAALARIRGDEQVSLADRLEAQRLLQPTLAERHNAAKLGR